MSSALGVVPALALAQVGKAQQEQAGLEQVKEQMAVQVRQQVREILQREWVRVQGLVIFQPELRRGPRAFPVLSASDHLYGAPQQATRGRRGPLLQEGQKG